MSYQIRKESQNIARDADQAELKALELGTATIGSGQYDELLADALDDDEVPGAPDMASWAAHDLTLESGAAYIASEIIRRQDLMGSSYPFCIQENNIIHNPSETLAYEFCLIASFATSLLEKQNCNSVLIAFERLSRDVMCCFLGTGAESFRTGWPPDDLETRPSKIKKMFSLLNEITGEWEWCPAHDCPDDPADPNDEGIDFVVWKLMPDRRTGHIFVLGQCTCGQGWSDLSKMNDLKDKYRQLKNTWFNKHPLGTKPIFSYSIPFHIAGEHLWRTSNLNAGLTLDRARIALIAEKENNKDFIIENTKKSMIELIRFLIPTFEVV